MYIKLDYTVVRSYSVIKHDMRFHMDCGAVIVQPSRNSCASLEKKSNNAGDKNGFSLEKTKQKQKQKRVKR